MADYLTRTRGVPFEAGRVVVAPGAKPFLLFSVLATCNPGDEVVYPDPGFPIYESVIRFAGACRCRCRSPRSAGSPSRRPTSPTG